VRLLLALLLIPPCAYAQTDSVGATSSLHGFPYVYYTPETGWAFGGVAVYTFRIDAAPDRYPSSAMLDAYFTVNRQYKITLLPEVYFKDNRFLVSLSMEFGRILDRFWGIGPHTADSDSTELVKAMVRLQAKGQVSLSHHLKAGLVYAYDREVIRDAHLNPLLNRGAGAGTVTAAGLGVTATWDSRDNIFYPSEGSFHQIEHTVFAAALGGDVAVQRTIVDLRGYFDIGGGHIIALQGMGTMIGGSAPYFLLAPLGGEMVMRGYYTGRYRDKILLAGQVEYRKIFFWRIGGAIFAGGGDVAPDFAAFHLRDLKPTYGAGVRYLLDTKEKVTLRIDYGRGRGTDGIYLAIKEAF